MKIHFIKVAIISVLLIAAQQTIAAESIKQATPYWKVVRTAKEKLGSKASDNQRVNNCKVPVEKRGPKPRPDKCRNVKP